MNSRSLDYIGILGYSTEVSQETRQSIESLTRAITLHGLGICAGCITGALYFAFREAKLVAGHTWLINQSEVSHTDRHLCDILEMVADPIVKHQSIAQVCIGGIVVSGGMETRHLVECFLERNKPVLAISKDIEQAGLSSNSHIKSNYNQTIKQILSRV
ncbi:MAG: hypothetical protein V3T17_16030 [Pseudomonadales bacterium]